MATNPEIQNYIRLMATAGYGHPMTPPDTAMDNPMKDANIGDVGYIESDNNTWVKLWNVFDKTDSTEYKESFKRSLPTDFSPWNGSDLRYLRRPVLPTVIPVGCKRSDNNSAAEEFQFSFESGGAALILPKSPTMLSLSELSLTDIKKYFVRDLPAWLSYARIAFQMGGLVETDLALIYAVVKTSDWALASNTESGTKRGATFSVIDASAGVWGSWQTSNGILAIAGPQRPSVKDRPGPEDQCVFVKRLVASPMPVGMTRKNAVMARIKSWPSTYSVFNPEPNLEVSCGAGPPDIYIQQLRTQLEGDRFRILGDITFTDKAVSKGSVIKWTSVLSIGTTAYGQGQSRSKERAQQKAVENTIPLLRSDDLNIQTRNSRAPADDLIDPSSTPTCDDPLNTLLNHLRNTDEASQTTDDTIKYAVATDDDIAALLKDAAPDDDFEKIIKKTAFPVVIGGVVQHGKISADNWLSDRVRLDPPNQARPLARGPSSDVWLGVLTEQPSGKGVKVAIKSLRLPEGAVENEVERIKRSFERKMAVWRGLSHPNILPMLGMWDTSALPPQIDPRSPVLVCTYCENKSLPEYLDRYRDADRLNLVKDIVTGLAYLHKNNVAHADLKGPNVVIDGRGRALLANFGLATILGETGLATKSVMDGSIRYTAPEMLLNGANGDDKGPGSRRRATESGDIWSFGMTALEIFSGKLPFYGLQDLVAVVLAISKGRRPAWEDYRKVPKDCWRILESCWAIRPAQRPTAAALVDKFTSMSGGPGPELSRTSPSS